MNILELWFANPMRELRVEFKDGEVFVLRNVYQLEGSGTSARYSGLIVELANVSEQRRRLFRKGGGMDFDHGDIAQIVDRASGSVLFSAQQELG